jgi:hypothetical protein
MQIYNPVLDARQAQLLVEKQQEEWTEDETMVVGEL